MLEAQAAQADAERQAAEDKARMEVGMEGGS